MNEKIRTEAFVMITEARAREAYDTLCAACDAREGGLTNADQLLIGDWSYAEQIKAAAAADITRRGLGKEYHNGRSSYYKENPSIKTVRDQTKLQATLMNELRLTPKSRKATPVELDDDFDSFD